MHLPLTNLETSPLEFQPPLLRLQDSPPNPLGRKVLWALLLLLVALLLWALIGRLDIVAVAEGKLIPETYVKIVQPAESGIVKEILVKEGQGVNAGDVVMRMDALISEADTRALDADLQRKRLTLRRIKAELSGQPFAMDASDPPELAREIEAQFKANRVALEAALAEERSRLVRNRQDLAAAEQVRRKLEQTLPHYQEQEKAYQKLVKDGFAGSIMGSEKRRERIEKEQELQTQVFIIESAKANILQSEKRLAQIESEYRRQLHSENNEIQGALDRLVQESAKQGHKQGLLNLRAPQDGVIKDLATHTAGSVVQPGTVLMTLVPKGDVLRAEVWVSNEDIGFVRQGQAVKLKFAAFPFQKYGMADGTVEHVSADATDKVPDAGQGQTVSERRRQPLVYKALVKLQQMALEMDGQQFVLSAGMQTNAEIRLGERTVMEYLLSPVRKAWHEAGRER
jgi:HlyD family secretion protein